jgi:hypothetical protein
MQELGSLGLRKHGPQEESELEGMVKGDPADEEINKGFNDGEKRKDDPVDEPLNVITLLFVFNGFKGLEGRAEETNDGAKNASANSDSKEEEDGEDGASAEEKTFLGDLQGFWSVQHKGDETCCAVGAHRKMWLKQIAFLKKQDSNP